MAITATTRKLAMAAAIGLGAANTETPVRADPQCCDVARSFVSGAGCGGNVIEEGTCGPSFWNECTISMTCGDYSWVSGYCWLEPDSQWNCSL